MNKREKFLLIFTVVAIGAWIVLSFLPEGDGGGSDASSDAVDAQREMFVEMVEEASNAEEIYRSYYELVGPEGSDSSSDPSSENYERPDLEFQRAVSAMCDRAGFPRPNISKEIEEIDDVEDYVLLLVTVDIDEGDMDRVSELMKIFDTSGLIITQADIRNSRDSDQLSAVITVGKLAEQFATSRRGRN